MQNIYAIRISCFAMLNYLKDILTNNNESSSYNKERV